MKNIKEKEYYESFINEKTDSIQELVFSLENDKISEDRVDRVKLILFKENLHILIAQYGRGDTRTDLVNQFNVSVDYMLDAWKSEVVKVYAGKKRIELNQYNSTNYVDMLWMLSFGILIEAPVKKLNKLVSFIDRDEVKDFLFEFMISSFSNNRPEIFEESYQKFFGVNKQFGFIKDLLKEKDTTILEKGLKGFLSKKWYKGFNKFGWYDSHKLDGYGFFGYWAFSIAAIVKIKNLDDSDFKENPYYPDLLLTQ